MENLKWRGGYLIHNFLHILGLSLAINQSLYAQDDLTAEELELIDNLDFLIVYEYLEVDIKDSAPKGDKDEK